MSPDERFLAALRALPAAERQNRAMRVTDRELALAMRQTREPDRAFVLAQLGPEKARRVREELLLHERLSIRHEDYLRAVSRVTRSLEGTGGKAGLRSYLRPRGRTGAGWRDA